ncbi:hypothetical protein HY230_04075 [Candidatus Acetothermia bacterium]|nr:hypothetical protein [Candidatus Acetothermia bacterium]
MAITYKLVPERCRVRTEPDRKTWLQVVYALNTKPAIGTRQRLVPALKQALAAQKLELIALDLFDEFVKLHLPLEASAKTVEAALKEVLGKVEESTPAQVPKEAEEKLRQYLREGSR